MNSLGCIRERVQRVCKVVHRDASEITIMAVTKAVGPEKVNEAAELGIRVFGENRVQEAMEKIPCCPGNIEWHFIGHLQSNKVRQVVAYFDMIHSIDSWKLLKHVNTAAKEKGCTMPVCLQVNVAGESTKHGFSPHAILSIFEQIGVLENVSVEGLMAIPPFMLNPTDVRPYFRRITELKALVYRDYGISLSMLSMGMSHDFEAAIEEGATCVRLGRALFGERRKIQRGKN